jgi:hypothetical protein
MKKIIFMLCLLFIASSSYAEDVKIYDKNYHYVGKIDTRTGNVYDNKWRRVGKVDTSTGKVYDKNYNRVGSYRGSSKK